MKKISQVFLAAGLFSGIFLTSCSLNDEPVRGGHNGMLLKAPSVTAYSGGKNGHYWDAVGGTRSAFPNNNEWQNVPPAITVSESEYVARWFEEHPGYSDEAFDFTDFYVQHVYMRPGNKDGIWHRYDQNRPNNIPGASAYWDEDFSDYGAMDKLLCGSAVPSSMEEVSNFNATSGSIMMMVNSSAKQWGYHSTWGTEKDGYFYYFRAAVIDVPGVGVGCYVGLSYYAKKYDNGDKELGIQRVEYCDDWIVKITPADGSVIPPVDGSENDGDGKLCDKRDCEHESHGDNGCKSCYEEGRDNECSTLYFQWLVSTGQASPDDGDEEDGGNNGGQPDNPSIGETVKKGLGEVEVNLALDEKKDRLLESHLSLHVRHATDVEIFIPVPAQYYCQADDMAIILNKEVEFVHGGPYVTEYEVGGNKVSLSVTFEENGIRISTTGINQDVIDYCWEHYQDGITFEVWNYFNNPATGLPYISMEELKTYLDRATVTFTDTPDQYINAFGRDNGKYSGDNPDGKDFHVVPEDASPFDDPVEGPHQNGSDKNDIYVKS